MKWCWRHSTPPLPRREPGNHWNQAHEAAVHAITQGLVSLGLLKGRVPKLIKDGAYRRFFMHRTGHWLGMDVHDVGDYKVGDEWRVLEPGMAMTVEPGIYIPAGSRGVPKRFWNIGIRIEDDVVVTADGCEILTDGVPARSRTRSRPSCRPARMSALPPGRFDIAIVGGGLVGASLAVALRGSRYRIALIEASRRTALAAQFRRAHHGAGQCQPAGVRGPGRLAGLAAQAAAITRIHVSDAGRFGFARLAAAELGLEALGYVVPNRVLGRELWGRLRDAPQSTPSCRHA